MRFTFQLMSVVIFTQYSVGAPLPRGKSVLSEASVEYQGERESSRNLVPNEVTEAPRSNLANKKKGGTPVSNAGASVGGNLPQYLKREKQSARDLSRVMFVPEKGQVRLKDLRVGDILEARVDQAIVASPSVPTPIVARVISKPQLGSVFIGEATLDRELKRVLIRFNKFRSKGNDLYSIRAEALQMTGEVGLRGEYHDQSGKFFLAEMASATSAGILDSTINRSQTINGGFVQEPSLANASKSGAVAALSRTADRMAERVRQAPEYTELGADQSIKIMITEGGYLNE